MGNTLGGNKTTKIMKIDGETFKLKTPVTAEEVLKDFPGLVLLDSESVKHYGARAKPLKVTSYTFLVKTKYVLIDEMESYTRTHAFCFVLSSRSRGWRQSDCISWWSR